MGILSQLSEIGEDKINVQFVSNAMISAKDKKRTKDTEITFATNETNTNELINNTGKVGVILWLNREDVERVNGK